MPACRPANHRLVLVLAGLCLAFQAGCSDDKPAIGPKADAVATGDSGGDLGMLDAADGAPACTAAGCDDKNACTDDQCDTAGKCQHANNTASCDDANLCTSGDACKDGGCTPGTAVDCDDKKTCTTDTCDPASGCVHAALDATPCDDGDGCTAGDACQAGKCGSGAPLTCDDGNPCTDDTCDPTAGCAHKVNAAPCTDGNACTSADVCQDGACLPGNATACDDLNPCTTDQCDGASGGCVYLATAATCSDGDACTTADACTGGLCAGKPGACGCATAADCNDKNACTKDACAENQCSHVALADGATCSDGDACTEADLCTAGQCAGKALACDDGNPCTTDSCLSGIGCSHFGNDAACDDGNACTSGDKCAAGACTGALTCACKADTDCDDKNGCSDDACVAGKCVSKASGAGKPCEDGNACTSGDLCQGGACIPGKLAGCDDGNACTNDLCNPTAGGCVHVDNTTPCNDGDACTVADACQAGKCQGGGMLQCDDKNGCTTDSCAAQGGCQHAANTQGCEDGDACTTADTCGGGKCVSGTAPDCDDKQGCTDDACDKTLGCVHLANAATCSDANACTTNDMCKDKACAAGPSADCNDGNPCTDDACDIAIGCTHTDNLLACDDGDACTTADTCGGGKCLGGAAPDCDDKNPCTVDGCDKAKGCQHGNAQNGATCAAASCDSLTHHEASTCFTGICLPGTKSNCDDGNGCTDDTCDPAGGCKKKANTAPCEDGSVCTLADGCKGGACVAGTAKVCDDGNVCTIDACDPVKGCQASNKSDGTVCVDPSCAGTTFGKGSLCQVGTCTPIGGPVSCDDKNPCTDDVCTPTSGCSHTNNTAACDDGNACTSADACLGAVCGGTKAVSCDDKNLCTDDKCDTAIGCVNTANSKACDDGSVCTDGDACGGGACVPGKAIACDDKNACTSDKCDALTGCVFANTGGPCDDGNVCSTGDTCANGVCKATGGKDCDDGNPCTKDGCDTQGGCIHPNVPDGSACSSAGCTGDGYQAPAQCSSGACGVKPAATACDDKNGCTTDVCNAQLGCLHPANTSPCDDTNPCTVNDACSGGACSGSAKPCDDGNVCTSDSCDPKTGCVLAPNTATCDDGNACTTKDLCGSGACAGSAALDCDDKNVCTSDSCDPKKGCVHVNNTAVCDDGDACTLGDACAAGDCSGPAKVVCDDKNPCTNDACDPKTGCVATNNTAPCDDSNACTTQDTCGGGKCLGGPAPVCDDKNPCTADTCDLAKGCVVSNVTDGTVCLAPSCSSLSWQATGSCSTGKCAIPAVKSCDDGNSCTTDACDAQKGCSSATNAWGSPCTPADKSLADPFCAGTLCTGFEIKLAQTGGSAATTGVLTGIDRNANGVHASGWDNQVQPSEGAMTGVTETPLSLSSKGQNSFKSKLFDVRGRLAVGGDLKNSAAAMYLDTSTGFWKPSGGFNVSNLSRALTTVDMTQPLASVEAYVVGGQSDTGENLWSLLARANFTNGTWGPLTRMLVTTASGTSCSKQVALEIADVYQASDTAIFAVGTISKNGAPFQSAVAYYNGNKTAACGELTGYLGEAYVDTASETGDLLLTINSAATPAIGQFRTVAGTGASHVLVGGSLGTLFSYDAGKWTQQAPSYSGMPVPWSAAFDVRSVTLAGSEAWAAGEYNSIIGGASCRSLFALHGVFDATSGLWTWNKLVVSKTLASCGALDPTALNRTWIDTATGSIYFVGSQGTDAAGNAVLTSAARTQQLIARIKTK